MRSVKSPVDVQPLDCPYSYKYQGYNWCKESQCTDSLCPSFSSGPGALLLWLGGFAASWSGGTGSSEVTGSSASLVVLRDANFYSREDFARKNSVSCSPVWGGVPWGRGSAERAFILSAGAGTDCLSVCLNGFTPSFPLEIPFWNADFFSPHTLTFFSCCQATEASFLHIAQPLAVTQQSGLFLSVLVPLRWELVSCKFTWAFQEVWCETFRN